MSPPVGGPHRCKDAPTSTDTVVSTNHTVIR
jgi:hypothetical protein